MRGRAYPGRNWPTRAISAPRVTCRTSSHGLALPTVTTLRVLAERLDVLPLDLLTEPDADPRQKLIDSHARPDCWSPAEAAAADPVAALATRHPLSYLAMARRVPR